MTWRCTLCGNPLTRAHVCPEQENVRKQQLHQAMMGNLFGGIFGPSLHPTTVNEAYEAGRKAGYAAGREDARNLFGNGPGLPHKQRGELPLTMALWRALVARCHPDTWDHVMAGEVTRWLVSIKPES